jgi:hypothetical protein
MASFNTVKVEFVKIIYINVVCTSQEARQLTVKPSLSIIPGDIFVVCCENNMKHTNTLCGQNGKFYYV